MYHLQAANTQQQLRVGSSVDTKSSEIIEAHGQHLKVSPWHDSDTIAILTPLTPFQRLNIKAIHRGIEAAEKAGYRTIYSSALMDREISGFLDAGFALKEQLHVLRHSLTETRPKALIEGIKISKPSRSEISDVVEVDKRCFDSFWTMNSEGLREAMEATTRARFRVAIYREPQGMGTVIGYAITGFGDRKGYLQRLAVDPEFQGRGIAGKLVEDGFEWLRFWRAREEYVNTQVSNERALQFYLHAGFQLLSERLNILQLTFDT